MFRSFRCTFHGVQNRSLRLYNAPPPFSHSHETCGLRLASIFKRDFAKKDFFHDFFNLLSICTFGKFWKVPLLNTSVYLGSRSRLQLLLQLPSRLRFPFSSQQWWQNDTNVSTVFKYSENLDSTYFNLFQLAQNSKQNISKYPSLEPLKRSTAGHSRSISESWRLGLYLLSQECQRVPESARECQRVPESARNSSKPQLYTATLLHGVKIFFGGIDFVGVSGFIDVSHLRQIRQIRSVFPFLNPKHLRAKHGSPKLFGGLNNIEHIVIYYSVLTALIL